MTDIETMKEMLKRSAIDYSTFTKNTIKTRSGVCLDFDSYGRLDRIRYTEDD